MLRNAFRRGGLIGSCLPPGKRTRRFPKFTFRGMWRRPFSRTVGAVSVPARCVSKHTRGFRAGILCNCTVLKDFLSTPTFKTFFNSLLGAQVSKRFICRGAGLRAGEGAAARRSIRREGISPRKRDSTVGVRRPCCTRLAAELRTTTLRARVRPT